MGLLKKAVATNFLILMLAGSVTVGLVTYKIYQNYESSRVASRNVECINLRLDFCMAWYNLGYEEGKEPYWDVNCGVAPSEGVCSKLVKPPPPTTSTSTTSTSTISTSTISTSTTTSLTTTTICVNHAQCSEACDSLGYGDCPYGMYGCYIRDCCIGQCDSIAQECYCSQSNGICGAGNYCDSDCYCYPVPTTSTTSSISTTTTVPPENCCNSIDDDLDGFENGYDPDCQNDVDLSPGLNNICWWTEWDDYGNNRNYYSGWYRCPVGYFVDEVMVSTWTEINHDYLSILSSGIPSWGISGTHVNYVIDTSAENINEIRFRFGSDGNNIVGDGAQVNSITCVSTTTTSTTTSTTTTICSGTTSLACLPVPNPGSGNERRWGDLVCARANAMRDCFGVSNSHDVCSVDTPAVCQLMEPSTTGYSVSSNLIALGGSFDITVNGYCPPGLPGKCLIECEVRRPDGHYIYLNSWDEDGSTTLPRITCNMMGNYVVGYCSVLTDFRSNGGWGIGDNTRRVIRCAGDCEASGGGCRGSDSECATYCSYWAYCSHCSDGFSECGSGCCCYCYIC